jgi:hypothetical protein
MTFLGLTCLIRLVLSFALLSIIGGFIMGRPRNLFFFLCVVFFTFRSNPPTPTGPALFLSLVTRCPFVRNREGGKNRQWSEE